MTSERKQQSNSAILCSFVRRRVGELQPKYLNRDSGAMTKMARLRRGVGTEPGASPELWDVIFHDMPEPLLGIHDEPSTWERAAHDALTLYAVHQQSRTEPMHRDGISFGYAVALLGQKTTAVDAVRSRFHIVGTARQRQARLVHLRALIGQFRAHKIELDYGELARDLSHLEGRYGDRVRLGWARDYHRAVRTDETETTEETGDGQ